MRASLAESSSLLPALLLASFLYALCVCVYVFCSVKLPFVYVCACSTLCFLCSSSVFATKDQNGWLNAVRALLISSSCPERYSGEATLTVVYYINKVPTPVLGNISPFECLYDSPIELTTNTTPTPDMPTVTSQDVSTQAISPEPEPKSFKEASCDPLWQQAMKEELQALEKMHTWDLVDLPSSKTLVGC
ncbi:uncharacterized protein LOC129311838 [Prosopis cineraria]|uniref:uncharacterized protein LOC129311838 n=1 Tax=Prosopis cineraria TaxID=364024 RepID=UPI00240F6A94|nr:uncharacterized protein LOC129311838 [Prosopis cineraria]